MKARWRRVLAASVLVTLSSLPACGESGANGTPGPCDCGDDPAFVHAPLECACAAGDCPPALSSDGRIGAAHAIDYGDASYLRLYGTCASGHRVIEDTLSCENIRRAVWNEEGQFVYLAQRPFGSPPASCGERSVAPSGNFGIGAEDPSDDCDYCLFAWGPSDDEPGSCYGPLADLPACPDELYE
jgi:hypothetical protein